MAAKRVDSTRKVASTGRRTPESDGLVDEQLAKVIDPGAEVYIPAGQTVQFVTLTIPDPLWYVPARQRVQLATVPARAWYVPAGQALHAVFPAPL